MMRSIAMWCALSLVGVQACATATSGSGSPERYRLANSGDHWDVVDGDRVLDDLAPRYPEFFELILDPARSEEANLLKLRDDLEHQPVDRRNFDALNTVAIGYFELNYRAESRRGQGLGYMSTSFRTAKIAGVPWRAYGETEDPALRGAILDFFEDAASGQKLGSRATAPRLTRIVASLESKEADPGRRARIRDIADRLRSLEAELIRERE